MFEAILTLLIVTAILAALTPVVVAEPGRHRPAASRVTVAELAAK